MRNVLYMCAASALLLAFAGGDAFARIGERKSDIEKRLNSRTEGAYLYPLEETLRESLELPYKSIFVIQDEDTKNSFYFKRPDKELTRIDETYNQQDLRGWEIHIAYKGDISVMESYRRHGDAMTFEELEGLMKIMSAGKDAKWVRTGYVPFNRRWDVEFDGNTPKSVLYDDSGKRIEPGAADLPLSAILPRNPERIVYIDFRDAVKKNRAFPQTLQGLIYDDKFREAQEKYAKLVEDEKKFSDSRTSRSNQRKGGSSSKQQAGRKFVVNFQDQTRKWFEKDFFENETDTSGKRISIFSFAVDNIDIGGRAKVNRTKEIQMTAAIPLQPDTAVGYNYELSDGSMRAMVYRGREDGTEKWMVLFIDTAYDKEMRQYMESLYEQQTRMRALEAERSLYNF